MTEKELSNQEEAAKEQETADVSEESQATGTNEEKQAADEATENKEEQVAEEATEVKAEEAKVEETAEVKAEEKTEEKPAEEAKEKTPVKEEAKADTKKESTTNVNGNTGAHDDFDWDAGKRNVTHYSTSESKELEHMYEETITAVEDHQIVTGTIVSITDSDVVLNIGFKSDGLVPLSEFRDVDEMKMGDEVEVYLESVEDKNGQLVLSRKKAKLMKAWDQIVDSYDNDKVVKGYITSKTKGGLIVNVFGLETFLPGSQIDVKPIIDYDSYVGKTMEFKVVKINEAIKNAVVSHKALIESDIEAQRQEIISQLEKGQVLEGTIKNITDFGAFIDLGGVDGLLYITDISWGRINHPSEVLELNQKLNVVVLDFDDDKKRISLGLKQLQPHPWDTLAKEIEVGSKVKGTIVNVEDYGAFLEITPGVEGLIHVSEVSWANQPINAREFFKVGDEHESVVMTIDREERKMSLSLKRLQPDPWEKAIGKYTVDTKHKGEVKNITPYGVFVEMEEGIGGMIHISDLSWTKRYNHPSEFTKVGEVLDVVVLEVDEEGRKLSLGHKQLEEDPWDTFESVFPIGSVHEATVLERDKNGAKVLLPYGLEAYAFNKHLKKEDGNLLEADEKAEFKVLEFNRNDKRIIVSHTRLWEDEQRDEKDAERKDRKQQQGRARNKLKEVNSQVEKSTLGDLGVLSELKEKMEQGDEAEAKAAKKSSSKKKEEAKAEKQADAESKADDTKDDGGEEE